MNKSCLNNLTSISCTAKNLNKTRYDDSGKPMKQTSFTVKKTWGGNLPEK